MSADQQRQTTTSANTGTGSGAKPRPALDPLAPMLTQPFKDLVSKGVISELSVTFTPMGAMVRGKSSAALAAVENSGLNTTEYFPVAVLLSVAERGGLHQRPGKGKKSGAKPSEVKPLKSLVVADMELSVDALQKRCNEIAKACGGGPLVGRVRSEGLFKGEATTSYQDWWKAANALQRLTSLTEGKRRGDFTPEGSAKILEIQCPFRGTLEFEVSQDDDDVDGQGPSARPTSSGKGKSPAK